MKVAVYGICGLGEKHVGRAIASAAGADEVVVVFTTPDRTVIGAAEIPPCMRPQFHEIAVAPFRFDDARNAALALVPDDVDVCIALDMDETLEPGWREALEATISPTEFRAFSTFVSFDFNGDVFLQNNRVHSRGGWRWKHPCHEALVPSMQYNYATFECPGMKITHRPDLTKPRPNYLELLAWGLWEDPTSTRMLHYYGRELMFAGFYKDARERFISYLDLKPNFPAEVEQTLRYIAECEAKA